MLLQQQPEVKFHLLEEARGMAANGFVVPTIPQLWSSSRNCKTLRYVGVRHRFGERRLVVEVEQDPRLPDLFPSVSRRRKFLLGPEPN